MTILLTTLWRSDGTAVLCLWLADKSWTSVSAHETHMQVQAGGGGWVEEDVQCSRCSFILSSYILLAVVSLSPGCRTCRTYWSTVGRHCRTCCRTAVGFFAVGHYQACRTPVH